MNQFFEKQITGPYERERITGKLNRIAEQIIIQNERDFILTDMTVWRLLKLSMSDPLNHRARQP